MFDPWAPSTTRSSIPLPKWSGAVLSIIQSASEIEVAFCDLEEGPMSLAPYRGCLLYTSDAADE